MVVGQSQLGSKCRLNRAFNARAVKIHDPTIAFAYRKTNRFQ